MQVEQADCAICRSYQEKSLQKRIIIYNIFFMQLTHFSKIEFFFLLLLLGMPQIVLSFDNFQQRSVYYSDQDYSCGGSGRDDINFYFNLSDEYVIRKKTGWGFTSCSERDPRPNSTISPDSTWQYYERQGPDDGYYIHFRQEAKKVFNKFGKLQRYILNVTMEYNECKIEWLDYNCTIIGDGTIMHWGVKNPNYPPSELHLQCQRIWKVQEE